MIFDIESKGGGKGATHVIIGNHATMRKFEIYSGWESMNRLLSRPD